ncbi:hypothetical protein [Geminocystis sp. GBBB08]|nr:hypothetical protein [Geminocystis sp. GBBB08]
MNLDKKEKAKKSYKWGILSLFIEFIWAIVQPILSFIGNIFQFFRA